MGPTLASQDIASATNDELRDQLRDANADEGDEGGIDRAMKRDPRDFVLWKVGWGGGTLLRFASPRNVGMRLYACCIMCWFWYVARRLPHHTMLPSTSRHATFMSTSTSTGCETRPRAVVGAVALTVGGWPPRLAHRVLRDEPRSLWGLSRPALGWH